MFLGVKSISSTIDSKGSSTSSMLSDTSAPVSLVDDGVGAGGATFPAIASFTEKEGVRFSDGSDGRA
jgi:hypothetical protein